MKIDHIHVGDRRWQAKYSIKEAAGAFMDILETHENPHKSLSVVYDNGVILELKVAKVTDPADQGSA